MTPQDEAAFRAFVHARSSALLHTARLLTGSGEQAEDLVQEALARLVPRWRRVDDPEAYARVTMHRLEISRWRRRRIVREETSGDLPETPVADGTAAVHDRVVLLRALGGLTARQRSVLVCRYVEDLDEVQTAHRLGIRVGTVRSTAHRALAKLRETEPGLRPTRRTSEVTP